MPMLSRKSRRPSFQFHFGRLVVNTVKAGATFAFQLRGGGNVSGDHKFFDQFMAVKAFTNVDRLDAPLVIDLNFAFWQIEFKRAALATCME